MFKLNTSQSHSFAKDKFLQFYPMFNIILSAITNHISMHNDCLDNPIASI
jgi:hypothetical protein